MKRWITIGIILFIFTGIAITARTEFFRNRLVHYVHKISNGFINIGEIDGNILFYLKISNLSLGGIVEVDTLSIHYSPFSLLFRRVHFAKAGEVIINIPKGERRKIPITSPVDIDRFMIGKLVIRGVFDEDEINLSGIDGSAVRIESGINTTLHIKSGNAMGISVTKADGIMNYCDGRFIFRDMWVSTDGSRFLVNSEFGEGTFLIDISNSKINLEEFNHLMGYDISGFLYGNILLERKDELNGSANLAFKDIKFGDYNIESGNALVTAKGEVVDLRLENLKTYGGKIDGLAKITLSPFTYESDMTFKKIDVGDLIRGLKTSLSGRVSISGNLVRGKIDLDISGNISGREFESIKGKLNFDSELEIRELVVNDSLFINGRIGREYVDVNVLSQNLDISPFLPSIGLLSGEAKIVGNTLHPTVTGSFYIEDFQYKTFNAKYVSTNFIVEAFREAFLGSVDFAVADFSAPRVNFDNLEGKVTLTDKTVFSIKGDAEDVALYLAGEMIEDRMTLDTIRYNTKEIELSNASPVKLILDLPSIFIEKCILWVDGGYLECKGRYDPSDMDLVIIGEEFSIASISKNLKGRASIWVELTGNIRSPSIEFEQRLVEVFYSGVRIDTVSMAARYSQEMLEIERCDIYMGEVRSEVTGQIPLSLYPFSLPEEGLNLRVILRDLPAQAWKPLRKYVMLQGGKTDVDLEITGSPQSPDFRGFIDLKDINLRLPLYGISLSELNSKIHFSRDWVDIESFNARSGDGKLMIGGRLNITSLSSEGIKLLVDISGEDIKFKIPEVEGKLDMDISLRGDLSHPVISGRVDMKEALALVTLGPRLSVPVEQEFDLDIIFTSEHISVKSTLPPAINPIPELRSPFLDIELEGEITAFKKERDIFLTGDMEVKRGYFYYIDRPFEVTKGSFIFDNTQGFDPKIDLDAKSDIIYSVVRENMTQLDTTTVFISLTGRASQPLISIYSEPELPLEGILILLSLNAPWGEFNAADVSDRLLNLLIRGTVLADLEKMLGVDALRIETAIFGEERRAKITAGKYLSPDLYASYTKDLFSPSWSFKTTYRVLKGVSLTGERTEDDEYNVGMEIEVRY